MLKKCIHCVEEKEDVTEDHVLPISWYPTSTPSDIEKWTAPSCWSCNNRLGAIENELRIRLALCIDPSDPELSKIAKSAIRALRPEYAKNKRDKGKRQKMREKILKELQPVMPGHPATLPGFGVHPEQEGLPSVPGLTVSASMVKEFGQKILRGLYYRLERKYVNEQYSSEINITHDAQSQDYDDLIIKNGRELFRGPGLHIVKAVASDDQEAFACIITIWKRFKLRGTILRRE